MCGRFTLRAPASVVAEQFALFEVDPFTPRFNIAPSQPVAVVRSGADLSARRKRHLAWIRWGLIPHWAKDASVGNRMINARAESVLEKPAYRSAFVQRRCLIVADGFYEWQKAGSVKRPFFFHLRDDRPFAFAALWESWKAPDNARIESCTLLTTNPNPIVAPIHDRMPVILAPRDYDRWLDATLPKADSLLSLLGPYGGEELVAYPVSPYVNSPPHDDARCIERVAEQGAD